MCSTLARTGSQEIQGPAHRGESELKTLFSKLFSFFSLMAHQFFVGAPFSRRGFKGNCVDRSDIASRGWPGAHGSATLTGGLTDQRPALRSSGSGCAPRAGRDVFGHGTLRDRAVLGQFRNRQFPLLARSRSPRSRISRAITCFSVRFVRCPGWVTSIFDLNMSWGHHNNITATKIVTELADNCFESSGHRSFLLESDSQGRATVTVRQHPLSHRNRQPRRRNRKPRMSPDQRAMPLPITRPLTTLKACKVLLTLGPP